MVSPLMEEDVRRERGEGEKENQCCHFGQLSARFWKNLLRKMLKKMAIFFVPSLLAVSSNLPKKVWFIFLW